MVSARCVSHLVVFDGKQDKTIVGLTEKIFVFFFGEATGRRGRKLSSLALGRQLDSGHGRRCVSRRLGTLAELFESLAVDADVLELFRHGQHIREARVARVVRGQLAAEPCDLGQVAIARSYGR